LSVVFVVFIVSWSFFYTFMSMFLLKRYGATALHASFYMGLMGLGFSIGNGFLTGFCERRYNVKKVVMAGMGGCGLFVALTVAAPEEWVVWAVVVPATTLAALGYATILSLFSRAVDESHQGWVMGVTGAIMALSFGAVAIPGSYLASISVDIPIALSAIGLFASVILMKVMIKDS